MGHVVYRLITELVVGARTKEYLTKNQGEYSARRFALVLFFYKLYVLNMFKYGSLFMEC